MIRIRQSKQQAANLLSFLLFFSLIGVFLIILHYFGVSSEKFPLLGVAYGKLVTGFLALLPYYVVRNYSFLEIDDSYLYKGYLWKDKIPLKELTEVKIFAGELVLKTTSKEVRIDKHLIEDKDFDTLYNLLTQKVTSNVD